MRKKYYDFYNVTTRDTEKEAIAGQIMETIARKIGI
jgi:hypothetical protein